MLRVLSIAPVSFLVLSCSSVPEQKFNDSMNVQVNERASKTSPISASQNDVPRETSQNNLVPAGSKVDQISTHSVPRGETEEIQAISDKPDIALRILDVSIPAQTIPEFIDTVFGDILQIGFVMSDEIEASADVIALRSAPNISTLELFDVAINALGDYGVGAYYEDQTLHIVQFEELKRTIPRFIKARARKGVPAGLRPVVQFVSLIAIDANEMTNLLKEAFSDNRVVVKTNRGTNSLTLSGLPQDVDVALNIVKTMDVPQFSGTQVYTFRPENWTASELVGQLSQLLMVEGFSVSTQPSLARNITLVPIAFTNQISIFVKDSSLRQYVIESAIRLDRAAEPTHKSSRTHIYKAKYYDVEVLAQVLDSVLGSIRNEPTTSRSGSSNSTQGGAVRRGDSAGEDASLSGRVIPEAQGNRILFYGSNEEYNEIKDLLAEIDTPADEVLLEVTIAEVSLNDETRTGMQFLFEQLGSKGYSIGTAGGIGFAAGGLQGSLTSGDLVLDFGAFASNSQINVLSEPRLVTKSGATANINVGSEVPIITSQRAAATQNDGSSDILQSVQYRSTGIILDIEPIVFSDFRIDLKISQEVSAAEANPNQAIASPIISNRSLTTELSLKDGQSAILGGLIENRFSRGQTGVPLLKDVPILGRAFKTETLTNDRTILLVMVTPFVLREPEDKLQKLENYTNLLNEKFDENLNTVSKTLFTPTEEMRIGE